MKLRFVLALAVLAGCSSTTVVVLQGSTTVPGGSGADERPTATDGIEFTFSGGSMLSSISDGDTLLVDRAAYRDQPPRAGDVVVFTTVEASGERTLVKRIVGLPGEPVEYRSCQLYVNDHLVREPYLDPTVVTATNCGQEQLLTTIPDGHYFMMGDNRGGSKDSRDLGPISGLDIVGKVIMVTSASGVWHIP